MVPRDVTESGELYVQVSAAARYKDESIPRERPGYLERQEHIRLLEGGAKAYLVMCTAKDPNAAPREIKGFNDREVFVARGLTTFDEKKWIKVIGRERAGMVG